MSTVSRFPLSAGRLLGAIWELACCALRFCLGDVAAESSGGGGLAPKNRRVPESIAVVKKERYRHSQADITGA